jgi:hypothetical protein
MIRTLLTPAATLLFGGLSLAQPSPTEELPVTVEGTNVNGILFTWEVTNRASQAINYFEIPVFGINTFDAPKGWEIVSQPRHKQGKFILKTDEYWAMIRPNRTLTFECKRPTQDIPLDGRVTAVVAFEDGTKIEVPNVLGPVKRSTLGNLVPPVAAAALVTILVLVKTLRRRRTPSTISDSPARAEPTDTIGDGDQ